MKQRFYYLRVIEEVTLEYKDCFVSIDTKQEDIQVLFQCLADKFFPCYKWISIRCELYKVNDITKYNSCSNAGFISKYCTFDKYYNLLN